MSRIHFFAISDRWSSAPNNDAFSTEKFGDYHLFGVAAGLSDRPGLGSASGIAISSLIDSVREMKGSPAVALNAAVHATEARIRARKAGPPGEARYGTHLSAGIVSDSLDSTILDTGDGDVLLITPEGIFIPRDYPQASTPPDPGLPAPSGEQREMISHTLGEPHILKLSDFITVNIRDLFLLISSEGLHNVVTRKRIAEIVLDNGENVETSCQQLVLEARQAGSERTITVVLVHGHLH
jgi:serine/threonine protein phosphatase PrpC